MNFFIETLQASYTIENGAKSLVQSIDLKIKPGELVGLIGPNGAGKSTLMKMILGFLKPSSGQILLKGQPLESLSPKQRAKILSYMGQQGPESFPFKVVEIVEMGAYPVLARGVQPGRAERAAALEALNYVGMAHLSHRNFQTLSGGEKQLVLFARVLIQNTPIILLDEPTANLDLGHETKLLQMSRELCQEGRCVLIALHNLNSAAEFCDRLIMLDKARVVAQGIPAEVLTQENIQTFYHTRARIGTNESSGSVTVTPLPKIQVKAGFRVHVIGGAGSGVTLTRKLHLLGIPMTGGVAHELDNDAKIWRALGISYLEVPAFAEIDDETLEKGKKLILQADLTILCSFPFGRGNIGNLQLATYAQSLDRLFILDEQTGTCARGFYLPGSEELFKKIETRCQSKSLEQVIGYLETQVTQ